MLFCTQGQEFPLTLISLYSRPCPTLLKLSVNILWSCKYQRDSALLFVNVKSIQSVIAMIPHTPLVDGQPVSKCFFLVEKPGFDVAMMVGMEEEFTIEEIGTVN